MTSPKRGTTTRNACNRLLESAGGRIIPVNLSLVDKHGCGSPVKARGISRNPQGVRLFQFREPVYGGSNGRAQALLDTLRVPPTLPHPFELPPPRGSGTAVVIGTTGALHV